MNYQIQSDTILIALDDELTDQIKAGDSIEVKEHPNIRYIITSLDIECLNDRKLGNGAYLELYRTEKTNWQYQVIGFRISE